MLYRRICASVCFKEALIKLLRDQILYLRHRLPCSLYSRTGALLDSNFDRSLHLIRASLRSLKNELFLFVWLTVVDDSSLGLRE